jgi:type III pantothenate kinase
MLLVFDIGNTYIVTGVFDGGKLVADWRLQTDRQKTADEYGILLKSLLPDAGLDYHAIKAAIMSSVVPPVTGIIERMIEKYFKVKALQIGPGMKTGLSIKTENPREVGADQVVNAVAGIKKYGAPLIIVDFGTATTFCAIAAKGELLGIAIAPGLGISSDALFQRTAKLPRVEFIKPKTVVGKNTIHSMQSGLYFGYIGLVENLIGRMKDEMNCNPKVIATGGFAEWIVGGTPMINRVDPYLTLEGLKTIYEMNTNE